MVTVEGGGANAISNRNWNGETTARVAFIKALLASSGADGIVFGNSGGKDSALVGILCKMACENTVGVTLPCGSRQNYGSDMEDAKTVATMFNIETRTVDLGGVRAALLEQLKNSGQLTDNAIANIAPRLRMLSIYAIGNSENRLVAGTGNRSERYMGYFTKWGDGSFDFNPIADLTVTEVYEFLRYLRAPDCVINKAPSAGLFDGQTDEAQMGITYKKIDDYILNGVALKEDLAIIERYHRVSEHKRRMPLVY